MMRWGMLVGVGCLVAACGGSSDTDPGGGATGGAGAADASVGGTGGGTGGSATGGASTGGSSTGGTSTGGTSTGGQAGSGTGGSATGGSAGSGGAATGGQAGTAGGGGQAGSAASGGQGGSGASGGVGGGGGPGGSGGGPGGAGGSGGGANCSALIEDAGKKLAEAQSCTPGGIITECQVRVEGLCCPELVGNPSSSATTAYLAAVQAVKTAGCVVFCPAIPCWSGPGSCDSKTAKCVDAPITQ